MTSTIRKLANRRWHIAAFAVILLVGLALVAGAAFAAPPASAPLKPPPAKQAPPPANPSGTDIVISQIYGGGGNASAPWRNDFVELFNPTSGPILVAGWSVQYASAAGTTWLPTSINGTIAAYSYYLVQLGSGGANGAPLPAPDAVGTTNMAVAAGKVALVNAGPALTGACPTGAMIVDFVGYGTTANCFEGAGQGPAHSNTSSIVRAGGGCTDTDNNVADFASTITVNPRNRTTPINVCAVPPTSTPTNTPLRTNTPTPTRCTFPPAGTDTINTIANVTIVITGRVRITSR